LLLSLSKGHGFQGQSHDSTAQKLCPGFIGQLSKAHHNTFDLTSYIFQD
jgi:hypothetical protein